ncbi:hypothetical protein AnigIFM63604_011204 [Aspergillus niger]|uniref:chitinase n=1 Tax=Aspergillus niger TaxID=5061 RepID=A0A9W6A8S1_ASPNG|nr:hypothetical protein AnigIFM63604_011204 [Aspergillus niger]
MRLISQLTGGLLASSLLVHPALASTEHEIQARARVQKPKPCPAPCSSTDPADWFVYPDLERLAQCNESMLLDFNIYNTVTDPQHHSTMYTCTTPGDLASWGPFSTNSSDSGSSSPVTYEVGIWKASSPPGSSQLLALLRDMHSYLIANPHKGELFGYSNRVSVGVYLGGSLQLTPNVDFALNEMISLSQNSTYDRAILQYCGSNANNTLGVAVSTNGDITTVQQYIQSWSKAECISDYDSHSSGTTTLWTSQTGLRNSTGAFTTITSNTTTSSHSLTRRRSQHGHFHGHTHSHTHAHLAHRDSSCSYIQVVSDLCSTLEVGQYVCCSSGGLPDFSPSAYSNGTCYTYTVQSGDTCSALAQTYSLTVAEIDSYNNDTWGWYGCDDLQAGTNICLSTGNAPYPAAITNAVCGPQVPGTNFTDAPTSFYWAQLNPCPLNACCDVWGQCGTTPLYCNDTRASTGAPGTAAAGSNGCIYNCGTNITNYAEEPSGYDVIGYLEASSVNRTCLRWEASDVNTTKYTHVNFGFGNIASDFSINVDGMESDFDLFLKLVGTKRILSFGGWDFSTSSSTYMIFREGTAAANRETFATNVANFITEKGLDGVDFDWEYPGEPDISGIPAGGSDEGENYLEFLKVLRALVANDTIISVTAPSSYWYLKAFPIAEMAEVVDYINYMTYDLHGIWDLGNEYSQWGCSDGDCLFSHVNMTETMWALAMITKAGVATKDIRVGVSSYGRSFHMTTAGCYESWCTYDTAGAAGPCTDTAGYIAEAEMEEILASDTTTQTYSTYDTDILVYNETQWVGYMNSTTRASRMAYYKQFNFGGTAEWAIDLETNPLGDSDDNDDDDGTSPLTTTTSTTTVTIDPTVWMEPSPVVTCVPPCLMIMPPKPLETTTTITFSEWDTHITWASTATKTTTLANGNVVTYKSMQNSAIPTRLSIAPVTTNYINVWNQAITPGQSRVYQTSSILPTPFPVVYTPTVGGVTNVYGGTTSTIAGVSWSFGNATYTSPAWTGVFGGTTSVTGGTTLSPSTTIVTPHPYPTDTSTTDPVLNTRTTRMSTGSPAGPTPASSGEHTGHHCLIFCACALCPPDLDLDGSFGGEVGSGGGGSSGGSSGSSGSSNDSGDDSDDESSSTSSTSTSTETADVTMGGAGTTIYYEFVPTAASTNSALQTSIDQYLGSVFRSLYGSEVAAITATETGTAAEASITSSSPLCVEAQDPDSGSDDTVCSCSGGSGSYPTLTVGTNPCGYTALPTKTTTNAYPYTFTQADGWIVGCASTGIIDDVSYCTGSRTTVGVDRTIDPYPYTFTQADGDIVACATTGIIDHVSYCSGSRTTVSTASATATETSQAFAIWRTKTVEKSCVNSNCITVNDGNKVIASSADTTDGDFCEDLAYEATNSNTGKALTTKLVADFTFSDWSVCGVSGGYSCTETSSTSGVWECADADGGNTARCVKSTDSSSPLVTCEETRTGNGEDVYSYLLANCTAEWSCAVDF